MVQSADYLSHERDNPSPTHSNYVGEAANIARAVWDLVSQPRLPVSLESEASKDRPEPDESSTHHLPRRAVARQRQLMQELIEEDLL